MDKHGNYSEGQTVHTTEYITDRETGGDWPTDMDGTLMQYMDDGDWMVYVPGHGSVVANERQFVE